MPANKKLTKLLAGRTVQHAVSTDGSLTLSLDDGSTLTVQTAPGSVNQVATGSKLLKVREDGANLNLDLADESTIALTLVKPGNSVVLRDKMNKAEYLG